LTVWPSTHFQIWGTTQMWKEPSGVYSFRVAFPKIKIWQFDLCKSHMSIDLQHVHIDLQHFCLLSPLGHLGPREIPSFFYFSIRPSRPSEIPSFSSSIFPSCRISRLTFNTFAGLSNSGFAIADLTQR
jgi:hypothetical protein